MSLEDELLGRAPSDNSAAQPSLEQQLLTPRPTNSAGKLIRDAALAGVQGTLDLGKDLYGDANIASLGYLDPATRNITGPAMRGYTAVSNALPGQNAVGPTDAEAPTIGQGIEKLSQGISGAQSDFHQA